MSLALQLLGLGSGPRPGLAHLTHHFTGAHGGACAGGSRDHSRMRHKPASPEEIEAMQPCHDELALDAQRLNDGPADWRRWWTEHGEREVRCILMSAWDPVTAGDNSRADVGSCQ